MLKLAFVGLGWWGTELGTAAADLSSRISIAGCYAIDAGHVETFVSRFGGHAYSDFNAILDDKNVDGVVISTPHTLHAAQVVAAASAGKHVFVEKPLALTVKDGKASINAAKQNEIVLAVGHNRRFSPAAKTLRSWIEDGRFGSILHVEAHYSGNSAMQFTPQTWRADRRESPGGSLVSIGLHMVDTIQWLLGPIDRVCSIAKRQAVDVDIDDTTVALFELASGITCTFATLFAIPTVSSLRIYGTKGYAEARGNFAELVWYPENAAPQHATLDDSNTLAAELTAFADAIEHGTPYPVKPQEALANVAIIEAISKSAAAGGTWQSA